MTENTKYNDIKPVKQETRKEEDHAKVVDDSKGTIPKIEGVVIKPKKKNMVERLVVGLAGPNGVKGIVSDLYGNIIVPAIQHTLFDSVVRGAQQAIFGQDSQPGTTFRGNTPYQNYSRYPAQQPITQQRSINQPSVNTVSPKNVVERHLIADRSHAELALHELLTWASTYGVSSVADYLDMLGQPSDFTHNGFGWTYQTLSQVRIMPSSGAYYLDLPRPIQIATQM